MVPVVMRIPSKRKIGRGNRGAMTLQLAIILVPVMFGLMGFAIDLGRLYLIRGELNQAASAMAMAAAAQLNEQPPRRQRPRPPPML